MKLASNSKFQLDISKIMTSMPIATIFDKDEDFPFQNNLRQDFFHIILSTGYTAIRYDSI